MTTKTLRKIIICFDGTWNEPEKPSKKSDNPSIATNVLKFTRALKPIDSSGTSQIIYYHDGVGTGGAWDKLTGGVFGMGISQNIMQGYRFLANNYQPGNEIYIIGFSRGAYSARSLGGFISDVGIIKKSYLPHLTDIYANYRSGKYKNNKNAAGTSIEATDFQPSKDVKIKFIGVWDTVGALGPPTPILHQIARLSGKLKFHDTELSSIIENGYHAIAIDEERNPFKPTLWTRKITGEASLTGFNMEENLKMQYPDQYIEQVWFTGVHSNIGAGYSNTNLSNITLNWMIDKARNHGLEFIDEKGFSDNDGATAEVLNGRVEHSRKGMYLLLPAFKRPLFFEKVRGEKKSIPINISIHKTAMDAFNNEYKIDCSKGGASIPYHPQNLADGIKIGIPEY